MRTFKRCICFLALLICAAAGGAFAGEGKAPGAAQSVAAPKPDDVMKVSVTIPLMTPQFYDVPLALVNEEPVTVGDLTDGLATSHGEQLASKKQIGRIDYVQILDRLINVKLVIQEAARIGLDELPEYKTALEEHSYQAQATLLVKRALKDLKADPAEVEKKYKEMILEWKIKSILLEKEEDARNMQEQIKAGKTFDDAAAQAIADKKASGDGKDKEGNYVRPSSLLPHVAEAVSHLEIGSVTEPIKVQSGKKTAFTIVKLEDKRFTDSDAMKAEAERAVLAQKRSEAGLEYRKSLHKKYAVINSKLLEKIDYNSADEPKLVKLLKDPRVLVEIKDGKPITVAELTEALQKKHYHGLVEAAKSKKLNKDKEPVLGGIIDKRVIENEVVETGIAKAEEFVTDMKEFRNSRLFGLFVEKVVFPDVKLTDEELKNYYEAHKQDYLYPEMLKMTSFAFSTKAQAEAALAKLAKGADLNWIRNSAEGLINDTSDGETYQLNGTVVSTKSLPEDVRKAVAKPQAGDFRLYEASGNKFYVFAIQDVVPVKQQPYEDVREMISEKVFNEKMTKKIEEWFGKLKAGSTVKIYI